MRKQRLRLDPPVQRPHFEPLSDDLPEFHVGSPFDGIRGHCDECRQDSNDLRNRSGSLLCPGCDQSVEQLDEPTRLPGLLVGLLYGGILGFAAGLVTMWLACRQ